MAAPSLQNPEWYRSPIANGPQPTKNTSPWEPDPLVEWLEKKFEAAASYRTSCGDAKWPRYRDMMHSKSHWPTNAQSARGGDYQVRLVVNYLFAIKEAIKAVLLEQEPTISVAPNDPFQYPYSSTMDAAVGSVNYRQNLRKHISELADNAAYYGTGILKLYYDPDLEGGGDVAIKGVPTENFWADPGATDISDAEYIVERWSVAKSYIEQKWPDMYEYIRSDGSEGGSFAEQKNTGYVGQSGDPNLPLKWSSPIGDDPTVADKTEFSNPAWRPAYAGENYVYLYEYWIKDPTEKLIEYPMIQVNPMTGQQYVTMHQQIVKAYPNGRLIKMAGGVILEDNPAPGTMWPYVKYAFFPKPNEFYGQGLVEVGQYIQFELNQARSQLVEHRKKMGNSVWIVDKMSGVEDDELTNAPGAIIHKNQGTEVKRDPPPPLPNWILQAVEMCIRDLREILGASGAPAGVPPKGVRSGSGFDAAASIQSVRIRERGHDLKSALERLGRIEVMLIQQNYTPSRMVRIIGNSAHVWFVTWDSRLSQGSWDVRVEVASASATSQATLSQQALQLAQAGIIDRRNCLETMKWPHYEDVCQRAGDMIPMPPHEYPGYPGPQNPNSTDRSGYSTRTRNAPMTYQMPSQGGGQPVIPQHGGTVQHGPQQAQGGGRGGR